MKKTEAFLSLAAKEHALKVQDWLQQAGNWTDLHGFFSGMVTDYGRDLCGKPDDWNIDSHEAGGAWRLLFPQNEYMADDLMPGKMAAIMKKRREFARTHLRHGFADEAEVHHEIETFIYFQAPLLHHKYPGHELALESILDVTEHIINAVAGIPAWYDFERHRFRSTYLGTRTIRDYKPFDYQEANHWRFTGLALTAYQAVSDERYRQLVTGYASTWCRHIKHCHEQKQVIPCSILPEGVQARELLYSGTQSESAKDYQVFYRTVAVNTAYDVVCGLLDVYKISGSDECRECAALLIDQFFANQQQNRPATMYSEGKWRNSGFDPDADVKLNNAITGGGDLLARMALRYDILTAEDRYKYAVSNWAQAIDEESFISDQVAIGPLLAGWYYSRDNAYLQRAFAMALRLWAVAENDTAHHMCSCLNRYGSKFLMELCYLPLTGRVDAGTRGNQPLRIQMDSGSAG